MERRLFDRKKTHKVKGRHHITFMIITDPTKKAKTIKIPKWIRFPILMAIVAAVLISLNTVEYIENLESQSVINRLNIQTQGYTIEDKDKEISSLELTTQERNELLKSLEALEAEITEKYEALNQNVEEFDAVLNNTEKTTDSQPSEEIVVKAAEEIIMLDGSLILEEASEDGEDTEDSYEIQEIRETQERDEIASEEELENLDSEIIALNETLADILDNYDVVDEKLELLEEEAEYILPYWEAYPSGWPVNDSYIASDYGWRTHPITYRVTFHDGIDLAATYDNVYATGKGVVTFSGYTGGLGYNIIVDHGYGYETQYAHLSNRKVEVGDEVNRGDLIAISGNSGASTGPHLHYEVHLNGETVDPEDYLD